MLIFRQAVKFGFVGVGQIAIDWLALVLLSELGAPATVANVIGRILGASAGFWFNGAWTFSEREDGSLGSRNLTRFVLLWLATTVLSTVCIANINHSQGLHAAWIAKPMIDAVLAGASFLASKYWIYK